jgi:predicted metal-dependent phosphoesterase TrpH
VSDPIRDLHTHSNCSDGLYSPAQLVRRAAASGVDELSLTDHDTLAGLDEAIAEAASVGVALVPGIEFTCRFGRQTVHVLGYGFSPAVVGQHRPLASYLDEVSARDRAWAHEMCRKSCLDPLVVRPPGGRPQSICVRESELEWARGTMPSPFHFAVVLARKLATLSDELDIPARHCMYLFTGRPEAERQGESYWPELRERYAATLERFGLAARAHWWTPRPVQDLLAVEEAIEMLRQVDGIPVLAHPGEQKLTADQIKELAGLGIRGIEVYTFKHSASYSAELESLARSLGLFATSGSDFHDPQHRAQVELGKDRAGVPLTQGVSLGELEALGAFVATGPR